MEYVRFGDLYSIPSSNGVSRPSAVRGEGYKMINMGELFSNDIIRDIPMERVKLSEKEKAKFLVKEGDLLFARQSLVASGAGKCSIVKELNEETTFESHLIRVRLDNSIVNPWYYYYLFQLPYNPVKTIVNQCAQAGIRGTELVKIKVPLPPIKVQNKVAETLSTYDDLIENNNKRIAILEQMAENLYKEWFVRFRFPGYETAEFENGIPVGWEVKRLGDELTIKRGGSPRPIQDYITENGLKWLKISDATKTDNPFIFNIEESIKEEGLKKTVYRKAGSLVLSNSATPGLPRILALDTCIHDGWLYFENQKLSNEFLFLFFNHIRPQLVNKGNGAVFTNLKTDILKKYSFVRPADDILFQFDAIVQPLFKQIYSITQQNNNLIKQRDLLLPRLMSGKLEV